jgi:hypothetical protein
MPEITEPQTPALQPEVMTQSIRVDLEHLDKIAHTLHPNSKGDTLAAVCEFAYGVINIDLLQTDVTTTGAIKIATRKYVDNRSAEPVQDPAVVASDLDSFFVDKLKSAGKVPKFKSRQAMIESLLGTDDEYCARVLDLLLDKEEDRRQKAKKIGFGIIGTGLIVGLIARKKTQV